MSKSIKAAREAAPSNPSYALGTIFCWRKLRWLFCTGLVLEEMGLLYFYCMDRVGNTNNSRREIDSLSVEGQDCPYRKA